MTTTPALERLIRQGLTNAEIARRLHVATKTVRKARAELGAPPSPRYFPPGLSLEDAWRARTRPVDGGHLEWVGSLNSSDVPAVYHARKWYSARCVAFKIRTGRDPVGYVKAECGQSWCVAPEHVDDTAARQRTRETLRAVIGLGERPDVCGSGHDQREYGRLDSRGRHYCEGCNHAASLASAARRGDAA